jgi:hypothetical protein
MGEMLPVVRRRDPVAVNWRGYLLAPLQCQTGSLFISMPRTSIVALGIVSASAQAHYM